MGNWYTNVSVKGAAQADVVALLTELGRRAYVTPKSSDWVVAYDAQCDEFDLGILESVALTISARLRGATFASFNADDDVLWLALYEAGTLSTRYTSSKSSFEDGEEFPKLPEVAKTLARAFAAPEKQNQILRVLRKSHGALGLLNLVFKIRFAYVTEVERHLDLTNLLGTPLPAVGFGYKYVDRGETPLGVDRAAMQRTLGG